MSAERKTDIFQKVTEQILQGMQTDTAGEWVMPWHAKPCRALPENALTKNTYRGGNTIALWCQAMLRGYETREWATFRQWMQLGCTVQKGEKATPILYWQIQEDPEQGKEGSEDRPRRQRMIVKHSNVFNAEQVKGWSPPALVLPPENDRIKKAEEFFFHLGADIRHGGGRANYSVNGDHVQMPRFANFPERLDYYSVLAHELGHWTGAGQRLNRDLGRRFGDDAYAAEELVAELTAAFALAAHGLASTPRPDHAQYCAHYYRILGQDPKAIFAAAGKAQQAVDYLQREHDRLAAQKQELQPERERPPQPPAPHVVEAQAAASIANRAEPAPNPFAKSVETTTSTAAPAAIQTITERSNTMPEEQAPTSNAGQETANQEQSKTPPLYELELDKVKAHVIRNQTERGEFFSVSLFRPFIGRDGTEKLSYSIREQDIPTAMKLLEEAQNCIQEERAMSKEQQVQVTRNR